MASNSIVSNFGENSDRSRESKRKKRRRDESVDAEDQSTKKIRWRSSAEQITYSSKLIEALRRVRRTSSSSATTVSSRSRAVRETADKILAIAARGRSRWSRAILANRLKRQLKNHKKAAKPSKSTPAEPTGKCRLNIQDTGTETKRLPPLERRLRVLGQLVPGCRKLSFPNLLEETTDYISALEMQVRAMSGLAELLTGAGTSTSAGSSNSDRPDLT